VDAQRVGINYNLLPKSTVPTFTANGPVFPSILSTCGILFDLFNTSLLEYVGDVNVVSTNPISLLGLDVLKKFSIHFVQNTIVLER
jgi:predicted aspartyl protease